MSRLSVRKPLVSGKLDGIEIGLATGLHVLNRAAEDAVVLVVLSPQADEEAFAVMGLTGHGSGASVVGASWRSGRCGSRAAGPLVTFEHVMTLP